MESCPNTEGVESEKLDVLTLELDDDELLKLRDKWEANYASYESALNKRQKANKQYYLGRQAEGTAIAVNDLPLASNLLFEAEETFLPAALSKNPDPVVYSDNTKEGDQLSNDVKTMLQYHADQLVLRRKLTHMVRQWSIYFLGVIKHGWNDDIKDIRSEVRKIQDFIFDPNGCVDDYGDFDSYLGERITVTAEKLCRIIPLSILPTLKTKLKAKWALTVRTRNGGLTNTALLPLKTKYLTSIKTNSLNTMKAKVRN